MGGLCLKPKSDTSILGLEPHDGFGRSECYLNLVATIQISPLTGGWFTDLLFIHRFFFRIKKARFAHSHIHLAITGEFFNYSLHSREYIHSIHANSGH